MAARRDDVRLQHVIEPGRPARAISRHGVVGALHRAVRVERPDRQRVGTVPRRRDLADDRGAVRHLAVIARGHHDDNTGGHGALDRFTHRIVVIRLHDPRAQRDVDHPDVVPSLVRNRPVDRLNDVCSPFRTRRRPALAG